MNPRTILLRSFQELDNGVTSAVPIEMLEWRSMQRNMAPDEIATELQAALHEGHFEITSPGMVGMTETGASHCALIAQ
jgi:hypothetical protein